MGLFPRYPAEPGAVRDLATEILDGGDLVHEVATTVASHHDVSVAGVEGILTAPVALAVVPVRASSADIARCTTVAGGALLLWSKAIQTYDDGVESLNLEYETARAAGFHVDADQFWTHGATLTPQQRSDNYHRAVHAADAALRLRLHQEEHTLTQVLDADARTVRGVLQKGPSQAAVLVLAAHGALPAQASMTFPDLMDRLKATLDPTDATYTLVELAKFAHGSTEAQLALERATFALLQGRKLADVLVDASLRVAGRASDMRVLREYFIQQQSLNGLVDAADEAARVRAGFDLTEAAAATGKLARVLAGAGIASSAYDIWSNPEDRSGARRFADVSMDVTGILGGAGALALSSETMAAVLLPVIPLAGPVVVGCLVAAGAYAVGTLVYDHWDDITGGVAAAAHWTSGKVGDAAEWSGDQLDVAEDTLDDAKDWMADKAESVPLVGGLF